MYMYMYLVLTTLAAFFESNNTRSILPSAIIDTTLYRGEADRTLEALLQVSVSL